MLVFNLYSFAFGSDLHPLKIMMITYIELYFLYFSNDQSALEYAVIINFDSLIYLINYFSFNFPSSGSVIGRNRNNYH